MHLTPTEFDLLARLAAAPGEVLTRERLLAEVWGWDGAPGTRTVDSHVKALRAKIGAERVRTVHGVGYALEDAEPQGSEARPAPAPGHLDQGQARPAGRGERPGGRGARHARRGAGVPLR